MDYDKDCDTCGTLPANLVLSLGGIGKTPDRVPPAFDALTAVSTDNSPFAQLGSYRQCPECGAWFVTVCTGSDHFYEGGDRVITRVPAPDSDEAREHAEQRKVDRKIVLEHYAKDAKKRTASAAKKRKKS